MNKLPSAKRAQILQMMVEGVAIRAIVRMTGVSKNTVAKLLVDAGQACAAYMDQALVNLPCKRVQCDEIWSFVYAKAKNVPGAKAAPEGAGDIWTWTALCADTKLMLSWYVGGRDAVAANILMRDVAARLTNRVQLTTDGNKTYLDAVERAFGNDIDYAMLVKHYGPADAGTPERRYSPAECVERQNLNIRMGVRRFTRLTNAFSKKAGNHAHSVALFVMYHNFVRIHGKLRVTPAMAAKVTDRLWDVSDIVAVVEAWETAQAEQAPSN